MKEIFTIIRKLYPITVLKMRVSALDPSKCSSKFLSHELNEDIFVYVKCDTKGNIVFKGKKPKYSLFDEAEYLPTEKHYKFITSNKTKPKYKRYVSDGEKLYGVPDMALLLTYDKEDLMQVYVNTKYHYALDVAIFGGIEAGFLELENPSDEYNYPFNEIRATLEDFVKSGIFTDEDLAFLDERVLDQLGADPDKMNEKPV